VVSNQSEDDGGGVDQGDLGSDGLGLCFAFMVKRSAWNRSVPSHFSRYLPVHSAIVVDEAVTV